MITGRWAFAGQVNSKLGEPDDGSGSTARLRCSSCVSEMPQASGRTILFEVAEGLAPLPQAVVFQFKALEPTSSGLFPANLGSTESSGTGRKDRWKRAVALDSSGKPGLVPKMPMDWREAYEVCPTLTKACGTRTRTYQRKLKAHSSRTATRI